MLVIATPFATSLDHLRIADEAQFKFDRCVRALSGENVARLPVYGVGHSLGSLVHLLICSRYAVMRQGNFLMSFNNRPATDVIPFLSPFIAPGARVLGPILSQLASSPLRGSAEAAMDMMRGLSPSLVRQLTPMVEQLAPVLLDVSQGRQVSGRGLGFALSSCGGLVSRRGGACRAALCAASPPGGIIRVLPAFYWKLKIDEAVRARMKLFGLWGRPAHLLLDDCCRRSSRPAPRRPRA